MKRDIAEERGNLRAAIVLIVLSVGSVMLAIELEQYLIGFFVLPLAAAGAVFGLALSAHHGRTWWKLERKIRAMTQLPVARVIHR